jgi:predicted transcriptional regulator
MRAPTYTTFGPLETAILEVFWARTEALTVRDVHDALQGRELAYTTIQATMVRRVEKGWLSRAERERLSRHGMGCGQFDYYTVLATKGALLAATIAEACYRLGVDKCDRSEALAALLGVAIKR